MQDCENLANAIPDLKDSMGEHLGIEFTSIYGRTSWYRVYQYGRRESYSHHAC